MLSSALEDNCTGNQLAERHNEKGKMNCAPPAKTAKTEEGRAQALPSQRSFLSSV